MLQRQEHICENRSNYGLVDFAAATLVPEISGINEKDSDLNNVDHISKCGRGWDGALFLPESRFLAAIVHANATKMLHKRTIEI